MPNICEILVSLNWLGSNMHKQVKAYCNNYLAMKDNLTGKIYSFYGLDIGLQIELQIEE